MALRGTVGCPSWRSLRTYRSGSYTRSALARREPQQCVFTGTSRLPATTCEPCPTSLLFLGFTSFSFSILNQVRTLLDTSYSRLNFQILRSTRFSLHCLPSCPGMAVPRCGLVPPPTYSVRCSCTTSRLPRPPQHDGDLAAGKLYVLRSLFRAVFLKVELDVTIKAICCSALYPPWCFGRFGTRYQMIL